MKVIVVQCRNCKHSLIWYMNLGVFVKETEVTLEDNVRLM